MTRPMQPKYGIGFTSSDPLSEDMVRGYRYEQVGRHHNYHATAERWDWPQKPKINRDRMVVDGFSPNLNKELHVGHLRNLAIASALQKMTNAQPNTKFVALLGTSLGVKKIALREWEAWLRFTGYRPEVYYDTALPTDSVKCRMQCPTGTEPHEDLRYPYVWDGAYGPVIVRRSDGRPTYAYHDLSFADLVRPTHYITGHEQTEHFESLDLDDEHRPMGLVLGSDGKKLKSRDGTAMPAKDAIDLVMKNLQSNESSVRARTELAWNVLVWNFLQPAREKNIKFEAESWGRTEAPGMYISYTYARAHSALSRGLNHCCLGKYMPQLAFTEDSQMEEQPLTDLDVRLLGISEQYLYFFQQALQKFDPSPVANFAHTLAREIGAAYEKEQIKGGRPAFVASMGHALWRLHHCMKDMGMFLSQKV